MGQFDRFIESARPPARALRIFSVVLAVAAVVQAIVAYRLENVLLAVFVVGLMLPAGIAPRGGAQVAAWLEARPVLASLYLPVLMPCGAFGLATEFVSRRTSLFVAAGVAVFFLVAVQIGRRRAASSPRPGGHGELG